MTPRIAAGKKVELRPLEPSLAAALAQAIAQTREDLKRRFVWAEAEPTEADESAFVARALQEAAAGRSQTFAVVEAKSGHLAGVGSLQRLDQTPGLAELSVWIRQPLRDHGLGTDAVRNLLDRAFKGKIHKVWARVDVNNRAGRRVLKKLGFKFEGCLRREKRLNGRWADLECWAMMKEGWKK